ncbi:MAG: sugar ABC transporter substrate-binding protein [Lachnospiraceae bacterium]|nr:sugar ABC transporter substrate-binding protein [Lachnospiraceae bacterium]MDN4745003.1 sugar ABC transporter substrate-binding protein [Lachnospiraceae bacterium C1.1]
MKKRIMALLMTGIMTISALSGCGSSESGSTGSAGSESSEAAGNTLSIMLSGTESDSFVEGYRNLIDEFNKSNEYGVTIEPEFLSTSDYKTKLATMMASDAEPDIIFTYELGYLQNFVDGGKIVDLQEYFDKDSEWAASFNDGTTDQETYDGHIYGVPTAQTMAVMYYNKRIFEENDLSVPTSYEEYLKVCETLKANGITPVALASTSDDAWLVSQYIQQLSDGIAGDALFNSLKEGSGKWNDEAFIKAGKLFQSEIDNGYFENGFTGVGGDEARSLFQQGQTAMYFNGTWEVSTLADESTTPEAANIGCFVMPASDASYTGVNVGSLDNSFAVTKNCKNVDAAVAFLKFWTNEENESMLLYNYGKMPAISIDVDETKLSSLGQDVLSAFESTKAMTPWFDRMDTDLGNEFNNKGVAIANGDDVETTFNDLQSYAESR